MNVHEFVDAVMPGVGEPCPRGCGDWVDHTCTDDVGRCAAHCVCSPRLGTVDVELTLTLADAVDAQEAARRFLRVVRNAPVDGTELVVSVCPHAEGFDLAEVRLSAQQQRQECGADVLDVLYAAAGDGQAAVLDELTVRAGLIWECGCRWRNRSAERECGTCGKPREAGRGKRGAGVVLAVPEDFPVAVLAPDEAAGDRVRCGRCERSWDDAVATAYTPAPGGRCPFEAFHGEAS